MSERTGSEEPPRRATIPDMRGTVGIQSYAIGVVAVVMLAAPGFVLGYTSAEAYEVEIVRWAGLFTLGLAAVRPWAIRDGGRTAWRMRAWTTVVVGCGFAYIVGTNPLFLVVGLAAIAAAMLDTSIEWATRASEDLRLRLMRDRG